MKKAVAYILLIILVASIIVFGIYYLQSENINLNMNNPNESYSYEASKKDELLNKAFFEAKKILDSEGNIHIETAQCIMYLGEKCCDVEFPIDNSDYYVVVTFLRENKDDDWEINEVKKLTTNQFLDT